jgi:hypothetical protein
MAFRKVEETITEAARARNIEIADGAQGMPGDRRHPAQQRAISNGQ